MYSDLNFSSSEKDVSTVVGVIVLSLLLILGVLFLYAWIGCWLWGIIAVSIFGLPSLTYWQFFGLLVLVRIILPTSTARVNKKD